MYCICDVCPSVLFASFVCVCPRVLCVYVYAHVRLSVFAKLCGRVCLWVNLCAFVYMHVSAYMHANTSLSVFVSE
jgi:hypothetical protein